MKLKHLLMASALCLSLAASPSAFACEHGNGWLFTFFHHCDHDSQFADRGGPQLQAANVTRTVRTPARGITATGAAATAEATAVVAAAPRAAVVRPVVGTSTGGSSSDGGGGIGLQINANTPPAPMRRLHPWLRQKLRRGLHLFPRKSVVKPPLAAKQLTNHKDLRSAN